MGSSFIEDGDLRDAVSFASEQLSSLIKHNDQLFLNRVYDCGLKRYSDRLQAINFSGHERVLDAGCGFGQWSLALAELNTFVDACDTSDLRIRFLDTMSSELNINNIKPTVSAINQLPYADSSFDAVFCYGTLFLSPWMQSISEFRRVLKSGGKLYVNANGIGWYCFLWSNEHNKADDYDPKQVAANAFIDTLTYTRSGVFEPGMNIIIEPDSLRSHLEDSGFTNVILDSEGTIYLNRQVSKPAPFFQGEYMGQAGIYELLCTKEF